jgi:two-component system, OmpR family, alkaline phosphatase synthesis response regulator PhoP
MSKSKILIADDNIPNVELLEAYLAEMECEIAVAADGQETMDKVREFQPDLILLDIMMPKLSGFEVCRALKKDPATKEIMILMVTALDEPGDIERALAAGCNDFLSKPINKFALLIRVKNMLELRHVVDELEQLKRYIDGVEDSLGPVHEQIIQPKMQQKVQAIEEHKGKSKTSNKGKTKDK